MTSACRWAAAICRGRNLPAISAKSFAQRYRRAASMKHTGQFAPARRQSLTTVWLLLALPPVLFFAIIVLASALTAASGVTDPGMIAERVSSAASWLILAVQLTMLAMLGLSARQLPGGWGDLGWSSAWIGNGAQSRSRSIFTNRGRGRFGPGLALYRRALAAHCRVAAFARRLCAGRPPAAEPRSRHRAVFWLTWCWRRSSRKRSTAASPCRDW